VTDALGLIIEDVADLAAIFAEALHLAELDTEIIVDGGVAAARLREVVPKVVVLDLHLPQVSGETLLRQIRSTPALASTRVIIATADPVMADGLSLEADLVLIKPVSFSQLRDFALRMKSA
jgi:two-component system, repressor protein LuxO